MVWHVNLQYLNLRDEATVAAQGSVLGTSREIWGVTQMALEVLVSSRAIIEASQPVGVTQLVAEELWSVITPAVTQVVAERVEGPPTIMATQLVEETVVGQGLAEITQAVVELIWQEPPFTPRCFVYTPAKTAIATGQVDWLSGDYRAALITSHYPIRTAHQFASALSGGEVSAVGYTRLPIESRALVAAGSAVEWMGSAVVWDYVSTPQDIMGVVVLRVSGGDATSPLLCFTQTSAFPVSATSGVGYRFVWPSNVVLRTP